MHMTEISHVLDTNSPMSQKFAKLTSKKKLAAIRHKMYNSWISFCKTGDPNGSHLPFPWEPYTAEERSTYIFNNTCSVEKNPNGAYFDLWKDISLYE